MNYNILSSDAQQPTINATPQAGYYIEYNNQMSGLYLPVADFLFRTWTHYLGTNKIKSPA